jgi:hypothetical protein
LAFDNAEMDFSGWERAWKHGGGRDLVGLVEKARREVEEERKADVA